MAKTKNHDPLADLEAEFGTPQASEDMMKRLRDGVRQHRDLQMLKVDQEAALKATNAALNKLKHETLPDLLDEAGVPEITIAAEGNLPAYTAKASPYYHAVISAEWPLERRKAAFGWLDKEGHGDLIKTVVKIFFPSEKRDEARQFIEYARKLGVDAEVDEAVPWNSLTSWLKDMIENKHESPPLDTLGAVVGRVVNVKEKKG